MKKLTEKEAIRICKELWAEIGADRSKSEFKDELFPYFKMCPLCEWVEQGKSGVNKLLLRKSSLWCRNMNRVCPLVKQYKKGCDELGYFYSGSSPEFIKAIEGLK